MNARAETTSLSSTYFSAKENSHCIKQQKTSEQQLFDALKNRTTVAFVQSVLSDSYKYFFPDNLSEAEALVENAFHLLGLMKGFGSNGKLKKTFVEIHQQLVQSENENFWFREGYKQYRIGRAQIDFNQIQSYIQGLNMLDFGCGAGYLATTLKEHKYNVQGTDVLDYRSPEARNAIDFKLMQDAKNIKYEEGSFDTVFLYHVLHHINPEDVPAVLNSLSHIGKRVIIKEDVYGIKDNIKRVRKLKRRQKSLRDFMRLSETEQIQSLIIFDVFANVVGQGVLDMNMPFQFKTMDQWKEILSESGFNVHNIILTGFETHKLHKSCQALIIADSKKYKS